MSVETVARRYATALADVVTNSDETAEVRNELKVWEEMMNSNSEMLQAFSNPSIAQVSKVNVLENLISKTRPTKTTANFLRVLLKNNRLTEIKEINNRFIGVLEERSGIITAQVTSARPLSDTEKSEMQAELNKLTGKNVNPNFIIDENIIAGVVTRIGSTVYDGSIKTKLEKLKTQLING